MKKIIIYILLSFSFSSPIIKSLCLPGWGELSQGYQTRGKILLYTESLLVISAYSFHSLSKSYESDYIAYAKNHANINLGDKDYLFAADVGSEDNLQEFNSQVNRERGDVYPDTEEYNWNWDSSYNRKKFNSMRINSINFEKYTTFALAAMVVNRVVSLVDVIILNKRQRSNFSSVVRPKGYDGLELELCIKF